MTNGKTGGHPDLKMVNPNAAAIDIGSTMHMAAVNPDADTMPVRAFGTFTRDLHDLANWFQRCGVTTIAIESTGVYWIAQITIITDRMRSYGAVLKALGTLDRKETGAGSISEPKAHTCVHLAKILLSPIGLTVARVPRFVYP